MFGPQLAWFPNCALAKRPQQQKLQANNIYYLVVVVTVVGVWGTCGQLYLKLVSRKRKGRDFNRLQVRKLDTAVAR